MRKIGIIAANGSRARFITAQIGDDLSFEGSPKLIEHEEVINPLGARPAREKFSDRDLKTWVKRIQEQPWTDAYVFLKHEEGGIGPKLAARVMKLADVKS